MKACVVAALAIVVAALVPTSAIGETAMTSGSSTSDIDIVHVEAAGSGSGNADINVFGKVKCTATGPVTLDVSLTQAPVGMGQGGNIGNRCRAGETIKWVVTVLGEQVTIDRNVTVVAEASISAVAITTEVKKLHWGLHETAD